jgi:hypothetical protein
LRAEETLQTTDSLNQVMKKNAIHPA